MSSKLGGRRETEDAQWRRVSLFTTILDNYWLLIFHESHMKYQPHGLFCWLNSFECSGLEHINIFSSKMQTHVDFAMDTRLCTIGQQSVYSRSDVYAVVEYRGLCMIRHASASYA